MIFSEWNNKFRQLKTNTTMLIASNLITLMLLAVTLFSSFSHKPIVVIKPLIQNEPLEIQASVVTKSYAVAFGLSIAILIGNANSRSVDFVIRALGQYVTSEYLGTFRRQLVQDMERLKANNMDMTFVSTNAYWDDASRQVVIDGQSTLHDPLGNTVSTRMQYRLGLDMSSYAPKILYIQMYSDN